MRKTYTLQRRLWRASRQRYAEQLRLSEPAIPASPSVEGLSLHIADPVRRSSLDTMRERSVVLVPSQRQTGRAMYVDGWLAACGSAHEAHS